MRSTSSSARIQSCGLLLLLLGTTGCAGRLERPKLLRLVTTEIYTYTTFTTDLENYNGASDEATRRRLRDHMAYGVMAEIERVYRNYETSLFMNRGTFNVASDFVQLGLSTATTVTNGERGKTILGALLSGVTGVSLSYDKNFFRQQTVQAIISSMQAARNQVKARIISRLGTQDTAEYPFEAARADLIELFFAGTLESGLQELHQEAATAAASSKQELKTAVPASKQDVTNAVSVNEAITAALQSNNPDDRRKVVDFLNALGANVTTTTPVETLFEQSRQVGRATYTDADKRKKYFDAARQAGLIH